MKPAVGPILDILSRADDRDLDEIVRFVMQLCDSHAAGITLRDGDAYHVVATHGLPFVSPAEDTFCAHTMSTQGVFVVKDALADPRFADIGWVDGRLGRMRFYASAPVYAPDAGMVGRLCVVDTRPRVLTALQERALRTMALSVTKLLELRLLRDALRSPASTEERQTTATLLTQLSAELSHDLRVPLSSIVASIEMLREELEDHPEPGVTGLLERAAGAADRMERMLDQNMSFGHAAAEPLVSDVDLGQMARRVVSDSATLLERAGAVVEIGQLPVVRVDPDELYSVLQNLLTNAVKFARPGVPARVSIFATPVPTGWRVCVSDHGIGIPEDRRVDVFSLFSRADSATEGHGIGLATVARIVRGYGGSVGVEDEPGGGARVWFELPSQRGP